MSVEVAVLAALAALLWPGRATRAPIAGPARQRTRGTRRGGRARTRMQAELADTVSLMCGPLRIGVPPATALCAAVEAVGERGPLRRPFADLVEAARAGESLAPVWLAHADALDSPDLRFVAQAWELTERTGAPLADALTRAEEVLRGRQRAHQHLVAAVAGPKASMGVLSVLPLAGPLVGLAFGVSPRELYLSSPVAAASAAGGAGLAAMAWWWSRRIVSRAGSPRARGRLARPR